MKEVEKIKQKRDDRRAAHMAIKEQYENAFDTSDPNWEFLAMIKWVNVFDKLGTLLLLLMFFFILIVTFP